MKYVLEGAVCKAADQVRIGVALADTGSGVQTWTAHNDRQSKDVRAVQDNIVRKVVTTLGLFVNADQMDVRYWRTPLTDIIQQQGPLPHLDRTFKTRLWPFRSNPEVRVPRCSHAGIPKDAASPYQPRYAPPPVLRSWQEAFCRHSG